MEGTAGGRPSGELDLSSLLEGSCKHCRDSPVFCYDLQTFWPELFPSDQGTLAAEIHRRALLLFVRTTRSFFLQPLVIPDPTSTSILEQNRLFILNIVRKRVLPQLNLLATSSASGEDDATLATSLMGLLLALSAGADKPIATEDEMLEERATVDAWALVDELLASGYAKWKLALSSQLREIVSRSYPSDCCKIQWTDFVSLSGRFPTTCCR